MSEETFRACAQAMGVDRRIAALLADCDRALAALPQDGGSRWLARLRDQRRRLLDPDLRTLAAVATSLAEDTPGLAMSSTSSPTSCTTSPP